MDQAVTLGAACGLCRRRPDWRRSTTAVLSLSKGSARNPKQIASCQLPKLLPASCL